MLVLPQCSKIWLDKIDMDRASNPAVCYVEKIKPLLQSVKMDLNTPPSHPPPLLGNGRRRSISCPSCNGQAEGNKLLAPLALACGADGSIFVGDFNYIRRIFPSGNVTSVMELR